MSGTTTQRQSKVRIAGTVVGVLLGLLVFVVMRGGSDVRMRMPTSAVLIQAVFVTVIYGRLLRIGYQRRRSVWTRRSWWVFALLLACAFAVLGLAVRMGYGVDDGAYDGMSNVARRVYFYTMFALLFLGVASSTGLALWLVKGRPAEIVNARETDSSVNLV